MGRRLIVIDAGHGGQDPGALDLLGRPEKFHNKVMGFLLGGAILYNTNFEIAMTRKNDETVSLFERVRIANELKPRLFISVHHNAGKGRGFESYVARNAMGSEVELQTALHSALQDLTIKYGFPIRMPRREDFFVLVNTNCPAILIEIAFLDNKEDIALVYDWGFKMDFVSIVARVIRDVYLG